MRDMARTKQAKHLPETQEDGGKELLLSDAAEEAAPETEAVRATGSDPQDVPEIVEYEEDDGESPEPLRRNLFLPTLTILAVVGWFGGALWASRATLEAGMPPLDLIQFIAALCVPPALIGIFYLLALRSSTAEARRWGATARSMRAEAEALERMVATLSRKIEDNRKALAEQTNHLMDMGDGAAQRLQTTADRIGEQAHAIDTSAKTLGEAVTGAEAKVTTVLNALPQAHEEMRDLAQQIEEAGLTASQRAAALDVQLAALSERGREADSVAGGAADRLAAHLSRMEETSEQAGQRLEAVTGEMSEAVDGVLDRAAQAVDEARKGIAAQGEAILAMLNANQSALDKAGRDSVEALGERISAIEEAVDRISRRLSEEQGRGDAIFASLSGHVATIDGEIAAMHESGMERSQALAASISALSGSVGAMTEAMHAGDATARGVIDTAEDLLTALDASTREMDETLPAALDRLDTRIAASRKVIGESKPELLALVTAAESTHDAIEAIADVVSQQRDTLARTSQDLLETLDDGRAKAETLETIVDQAIGTTQRFAEDAAPQLVDALVRVRETASAAADKARETLHGIVPEATRALETAGTDALRKAMDSSVRRQLGELAETTEAAVRAATRASERLTQQMLSLAETTASIEHRIEDARTEREKADSDNFARRVSALIETMNSASIDIAKCFSQDVSDSAWTAYLKGDRGVFTRRAVRLLDTAESKQIADLYAEDEDFRDNVNRYIHDFEAMLRQILSLREGSPLGVTLLSSDMGKLYVALAQAIERLRA
ncbi:coiled-coil domain-containing protein [Stakelama tenebrarum]|uniref:ATPase n=1 Tax=Stakelama tenebrarum TaxID=2711215 RepID=A0A6G6Y6B8_9SPHN|nr:hypothetical protein [Sphingosinithalassobacter tenebrarum]QIG80494.1 hypothetical protein G5C33_12360 [Sphingosinithalassobacter tenebrarum]